MGKHFDIDFKVKVLNDYFSGKYGGYRNVAKVHNINPFTLKNWIVKERKQGNQLNDIDHKRGRQKDSCIDYKERYEILKKYQTFIKAQREKK